MNPLPSVQDILPHKAPMVLIDSLVSVGDDSVHCRATIERENLFFDPAINAVPGWVGLEIMAQSVAAWAGFHAQKANLPPQVGFLLGSRRYQAQRASFLGGQTLDIKAEKVLENAGMAVFDCTIFIDDEEVARAQLNTYVPSQDKLAEMAKQEVTKNG